MPRSISELVADNFSKDPGYYDRAAAAQDMAAACLADIVCGAYGDAPPPRRVVEVGCGTGFLTRRLLGLFPEAQFVVTDISPAMLEFCRHATEEFRRDARIQAEFVLDDISRTKLDGGFDLVVSSFVFQWAGILSKLLPTLRGLSRVGGILGFATLGEGTFESARGVFSGFGVPFPTPYIASETDLDMALAGTVEIERWRGEFREEYPSMLDFLRHIRRVGAVNASGERVDAKALRRVVLASERSGDVVVAEYDVIMIMCRV